MAQCQSASQYERWQIATREVRDAGKKRETSGSVRHFLVCPSSSTADLRAADFERYDVNRRIS